MVLTQPHGRHELKFLVSYAEYLTLKSRFHAVLDYDRNAGKDGYFIRSIYFDDVNESAYYDKTAGLCDRVKYRLRAYNNNPDYIVLECKKKHNKFVNKNSAVITPDICRSLIESDFSMIENRDEPVCREIIMAYRDSGIKASVTVDYHREAYVYPVSNLRVTFDKELHAAGMSGFNMFYEDGNPEITLPVYLNNSVIVEVKYDDYLPEYIRNMLPSFMGVPLPISKYCLCKNLYKSVRC